MATTLNCGFEVRKFVYGYCIAADTGGFAKRNSCTVDLYMNTYEECCAWGYRGVRIYVL